MSRPPSQLSGRDRRKVQREQRRVGAVEDASDRAREKEVPTKELAPRKSRSLVPVRPLPPTLREQLLLCATEARHRGQFGPMVQALRELALLDEKEAKLRGERGRGDCAAFDDIVKVKGRK